MLGRNAARPLGMTPSRLVAAYSAVSSHRLAQWMLARPYTMMHMHRFLFLSPQLLLTNLSNGPTGATNTKASNSGSPIPTPTLVALDASAACQLHTSKSVASASFKQPQPAQEILLPADLFYPATAMHPLNGTAASIATSTDTLETASTAAPSSASSTANNAIAFNYLLAASWHPKSRQRQQQLLRQQQQVFDDAANEERTLRWKEKLRAAHPHPHPGKVDAGEDAFFHVSTPSRVALGVADGVGGWSEMGVDPALFSWALMNNAENIARLTDSSPDPVMVNRSIDTDPTAHTILPGAATTIPTATATAAAMKADLTPLAAGGERKILDAQTILDGAYSELVQSGTIEAGSSTACILSLCKMTGTLRASNLGDSAFLLIRDNQCIYESPSQQHFWNCPYQLTVLPPKLRQQQQQQQQQQQSTSLESGGGSDKENDRNLRNTSSTATKAAAPKKRSYVQDLPKDAVQTTHQLQDGDVIVLATDGFWDNVFTKEAIELVDRELGDVIREQQRLHQQQQHLKASRFGEILGDMVPEMESTMTADEVLARVRALSKRLTNTARRFSLDSKRMTPFSQGARHIQCGGKVDDITVIVTLVRSTTPHPLSV